MVMEAKYYPAIFSNATAVEVWKPEDRKWRWGAEGERDAVNPSPKVGGWHLSPQISKKRIISQPLHFCLFAFVLRVFSELNDVFLSWKAMCSTNFTTIRTNLTKEQSHGHTHEHPMIQSDNTWNQPSQVLSKYDVQELVALEARAALRISQSCSGGAYQTRKSCLKAEFAVCSAPGSYLSRTEANSGFS